MQGRMRSGGSRRTARSALAVAVLACLAAVSASLLTASGAAAAPTATVEIKDLTPPLVSVDNGGSVTFVNRIEDKQAGVTLPLLGGLTATVHTDVALAFNGGPGQTLAPGQSTTQTFPGTTAGVITYTYRVEPQAKLAADVVNQLVNGVLAGLPKLPLPTPFVVNTLVPLPNLPSVNVPQLPAVEVPAVVPSAPVPAPVPAPAPAPAPVVPTEQPAAAPSVPSVGGDTYSYGTPSTATQLAPTGTAARAYDASRIALPGRGGYVADSGSGGVAGSYDGATVPTFGQLAGLDGPLGEAGGDVEVASDGADLTPPGLSVPALLAVIALAGTTSALLRARRAQRG